MKIINLKENVYREGEYLIGAEATGSHACYMIYGVLQPGQGRELKAGHGHAEIFCLLEGELTANGEALIKGQAIFLEDDAVVEITNAGKSPGVYVMAGGHTGEGGHHH